MKLTLRIMIIILFKKNQTLKRHIPVKLALTLKGKYTKKKLKDS